MTMHKLTISGLDDFEATHISEILRDYKTKMMADKITAFVEDRKDGGNRTEWFDGHLKWHESIMAKIKWTKDE
jgi:hypothetical protein